MEITRTMYRATGCTLINAVMICITLLRGVVFLALLKQERKSARRIGVNPRAKSIEQRSALRSRKRCWVNPVDLRVKLTHQRAKQRSAHHSKGTIAPRV